MVRDRRFPFPRQFSAAAGAAVLCAAAVLGGCSDGKEKVNVLLITLDTLRADHLGCYGNNTVQTPNIDKLAAQGILFENAFASVSTTLPSHSTVMTGLYPHQHGVRDNGVYFLPDEQVTLGEILTDEGYATGAFVSAFVLDNRFGIDQGFDTFDDEMENPLVAAKEEGDENLPGYSQWWKETWARPYQRAGGRTVDRAIEWIREQDEGEPLFCWVHLFDPHMPYAPPEGWRDSLSPDYDGPMDGTMDTVMAEAEKLGGGIRDEDLARMIELYKAEVAYTDHEVGRLLGAIDEMGLRGRTLVILTADHGEGFGEHRGICFEHATSVYDEVLRVPLIVSAPVVAPEGAAADAPATASVGGERGARSRYTASLVDVLPTALDFAGVRAPAGIAGVSLRRKAAADDPERTVYFEALCSRQALPDPVFFKGVRTRDFKLFGMMERKDQGRQALFLFDQTKDPGETQNILTGEAGRGPVYERMKGELRRLFGLSRVNEKNPSNFWPLTDDEERIDRMRSLGYVR